MQKLTEEMMNMTVRDLIVTGEVPNEEWLALALKGTNVVTMTDSYKFNNNSFLKGVTGMNSYFESRSGAEYPTTVFFGLQPILLKYLAGKRVTQAKIDEAKITAKNHLGSETDFNQPMWQYILDKHDGYLPLEIKAVPEGIEVPESNVLMTIVNTDAEMPDALCQGLVNHVETTLTNVFSASVIASKGKYIKRILQKYANLSAMDDAYIKFQLHSFGQRSAKCPEAASWGGAAELVSFMGTDTVLGWECMRDYYDGVLADIGYSVFATEHNYMMYKGRWGESDVVEEILALRPTGIVSCVSDTYDIYNFVDNIIGKQFRDQIMERDGVWVTRPDSLTPEHDTPAKISLWILESLWKNFGGTVNKKGFRVLDPHVRVIYGDSLTEVSIEDILKVITDAGFSAENMVFGCGSYMMDKHNRDTQRNAYKTSAMYDAEQGWYGTYKEPLGSNKRSKKGRLKLVKDGNSYKTLTEYDDGYDTAKDELVTVFKGGIMVKRYTMAEVRRNANF